MRKRYKLVLNLDIDDPDEPFPAGGDYTHLTRLQGVTRIITSVLAGVPWWKSPRRMGCTVTLDKVIDKGEVPMLPEDYRVIIEPGAHNYSAYVPDLPGCVATGRTRAEVEQRMCEAIRLHVAGMRKDEVK